MYRVYFARAIDGLPLGSIRKEAKLVESELQSFRLQLLDPFQEVQTGMASTMFPELSRKIVENDLALLRTANVVLMDYSIPNRNYIGCTCELVYAYLWKIPVIAYVGETGYENRVWLEYHATRIYHTKEEAIRGIVALFSNSE